MTQKTQKSSQDMHYENLEKLKSIFPNFVHDGTIDFGGLKDFFEGEGLDTKNETYGLNWNGKRQAFEAIRNPATGTLILDETESKNIENTQNVFIEGDNLEVLKLLQKRYTESIKMIYIDPPYNTGKDFVYTDKFKENRSDYYERTGQASQGVKLVANPESNGRYHSDWLTMMYPRLFLARNLLRDDGVIFISIDDHEVHNLRMIMDEIFGEENFVAEFCWRKSDNQANIGNIARVKEYIVCYGKSYEKLNFNKMTLTERAKKEYRYSDNNGYFRRAILLHKTRGRHNYDIKTPTGKILNGPWMIKNQDFIELEEKGGIYWTKGGDEQPYGKIYLSESEGQITSDLLGIEFGTNQQGSLEVESLFGKRVFDFPKPKSLIQHFITIGTNQDSLILDFFAGSGTTAHAVMELNAQDGGTRKCISVQLPELTDEKSEAYKAGYTTISQITRERIRRAGEKILEDKKEELTKREIPLDIGFKAFCLAPSHYRQWQTITEDQTEAELKAQIALFEKQPLIDDYDEIAVVYEILIKEGMALLSQIHYETTPNIRRIQDDTKSMVISFSKTLTEADIETMKLKKEDIFVCPDSALTDSLKLNLERNREVRVV